MTAPMTFVGSWHMGLPKKDNLGTLTGTYESKLHEEGLCRGSNRVALYGLLRGTLGV